MGIVKPVVLRELRSAPITLPCLGALGVLAWWAAGGGYAISRFAPGGIALVALLAIALAVVPNRWASIPRLMVGACAALAAYTAWAFASLLWASDQGAAWQGALRTLVYLAVFCLFGLWAHRPSTAAVLLGTWVGTIGTIALVTVVRIGLVSNPSSLIVDGRLLSPTGYPNATAALFLMALWPALALAAASRVPWVLRGVAGAGCVVLIDAALCTQSRGAAIGFALTLVVLFGAIPNRLRHAAAFAAVAVPVAASAPLVIHALHVVQADGAQVHAPRVAVVAILLAALVAGTLVGGWAFVEQRRKPSRQLIARATNAWRGVCAVVLALVVIAGGVAIGNPSASAHRAWNSFKAGYGTSTPASTRLVSGLGSNRYDFYRVALHTFGEHPLKGAGVDNFFAPYLRLGRSPETPRYPHSIELGVLSETGVIGVLLLFGALAAAALCGVRALRGDPLSGAVAGGALVAVAYWLIHGSADWLFETPVLGGSAFALLGLGGGLAPRRAPGPGDRVASTAPRRVTRAAVALVLLVAVVALGGLWTADYETRSAGADYAAHPARAFAQLNRARTLNPFSDLPDTVAGSIAVQLGDLGGATRHFDQALTRSPLDQYATLQLAAIASATGRHGRAVALAMRATQLAPRDALSAAVLKIVQRGGRVDVPALEARIRATAQQLNH